MLARIGVTFAPSRRASRESAHCCIILRRSGQVLREVVCCPEGIALPVGEPALDGIPWKAPLVQEGAGHAPEAVAGHLFLAVAHAKVSHGL